MQPMLEDMLADQQRTLEQWETGGLRAALNPAEVGRTERSMEQIRAIADDMMRAEARLLAGANPEGGPDQRGDRGGVHLRHPDDAGSAALDGRLLRENAGQRDQAERELQQKVREIEGLNQGLEGRVSERTAELQKSNQKLARSNEANRLLASVVESSDDAIVARSAEGVIESWNAGAERLYGYRAEEIIGHNIRELLPPGRAGEEAGHSGAAAQGPVGGAFRNRPPEKGRRAGGRFAHHFAHSQ